MYSIFNQTWLRVILKSIFIEFNLFSVKFDYVPLMDELISFYVKSDFVILESVSI